jgi:hypothetical protein
MINKPAVARGKFTLDSAGPFGNAYLLSKAGVEIVAVKAIAGGTAIAGHVYDTNNPALLDISSAIPFAAESSNADSFTPAQPIRFNKGVYIVIEEGGVVGQNGEVTVIYNAN